MPRDTPSAFELDHFFELRRVEQLVVSPDGARAIVSVAWLDKYVLGKRWRTPELL